jgi:superkiller protein 3
MGTCLLLQLGRAGALSVLLAAAPAAAAAPAPAPPQVQIQPPSGGAGGIPITTASEEARGLFWKGREALDNLREEEAASLLSRAVDKDPGFAFAYLLLSRAQETSAEERKYMGKAIELAGRASNGERLAILAAQAGQDRDRARELALYRQLIAAYPNDKWLHTQLGSTYMNRGEFKEAVPELTRAIEIDPRYALPYNQLGYAYRYLENFAAAEQAFKKYVELLPGEPNAHHSYGEFLLKVGRFDEAIAAFRKALDLDAHFYRAYIDMGTALVLKDDPAAAREVYRRLDANAASDRDRRSSHFSMAVSYVDEGKTELALEELGKADAYAEKEHDAEAQSVDFTIMGRVLLDAGRLDDALARFRRSAQVVERSELPRGFKESTRRNLLYFEARVALAKGEVAAARARTRELSGQVEAADDVPARRLVHEMAGMIALAEKSYDAALAELRQSDLQDPGNVYCMGLAYLQKGDRKAARDMAMKAANFNRTNSFMYSFVRRKARQLGRELS